MVQAPDCSSPSSCCCWRSWRPALTATDSFATDVPSNPYLDRTEEPSTRAVAVESALRPLPPPTPEPGPSPSPSDSGSDSRLITDPHEVVDLDRPVVAPEDDWIGFAKVDRLQQSDLWSDHAAFAYFGEVTQGRRGRRPATSLPDAPSAPVDQRRGALEQPRSRLAAGSSPHRPQLSGATLRGHSPDSGREGVLCGARTHTDGAGVISTWVGSAACTRCEMVSLYSRDLQPRS